MWQGRVVRGGTLEIGQDKCNYVARPQHATVTADVAATGWRRISTGAETLTLTSSTAMMIMMMMMI